MTQATDLPVEIWLMVADSIRADELPPGAYYDAEIDMFKPNWTSPMAEGVTTVASLSMTCHFLRKALTKTLWKSLSIQYSDSTPMFGSFRYFVEALVRKAPQDLRCRVKDVRIKIKTEDPAIQVYGAPAGVCYLLQHCPNIRRLHLDHVSLNDTLLQCLISVPLEALHLTSCYVMNIDLDFKASQSSTSTRLRSFQVHNLRGHKTQLRCWVKSVLQDTIENLEIDASILDPAEWPQLPRLRRLAIDTYSARLSSNYGSAVISALPKSPEIEELILDRALSVPIAQSILPHLRSVVCSHSDVSSLVPGRPITHVEILSSVWDTYPNWDGVMSGLEGSLADITVVKLSRIVDVRKTMSTFVHGHLLEVVNALPMVKGLELPTFPATSEGDFLTSIPYLARLPHLRTVTFGAPLQSLVSYEKLADNVSQQLSTSADSKVQVFFATDFRAPFKRRGEPTWGPAISQQPTAEEPPFPAPALTLPTLLSQHVHAWLADPFGFLHRLAVTST